jgi:hypothetical protein
MNSGSLDDDSSCYSSRGTGNDNPGVPLSKMRNEEDPQVPKKCKTIGILDFSAVRNTLTANLTHPLQETILLP